MTLDHERQERIRRAWQAANKAQADLLKVRRVAELIGLYQELPGDKLKERLSEAEKHVDAVIADLSVILDGDA